MNILGVTRHDIDETQQASARAGLVTLLVVQIIIGYEWLISGLSKVGSGDFVSGLAANLRSSDGSAPGFYQDFLDHSVIPNARTFAVLIEVGELFVGVAFIVVAIVWLAGWQRLSDRSRASILVVMMAAALVALWMSINFHLASGGNQPWLIPGDGFDEALDIDTVLAFIEAAYLVFSGYVLLVLRRAHRAGAVSSRAGRGVLAPEA